MTILTYMQAIRFSCGQFYQHLSSRQLVDFQLNQPLLCMPIEVFHSALESALGRTLQEVEIFSHAKLVKEFYGKYQPLSFENIIGCLSKEQRQQLLA